ncbi:MAG: hypothetical protein Q8S53_15875 [Brevundimonas sp.]|uniref:hypothetical protein n=1 Tax=Brevundimonas sp. TaxID=1871086 RepID=UPI002732F2DE|nr:hypothetical protein [Brevundimonas sp.]MDP3379844.1 hypothetical protein [Brevundimonas sp.]
MPNQVKTLFTHLHDNNPARYTLYPINGAGVGITPGVALPHDNNTVAGIRGAWTQMLAAAAAPAVEFWYCGYQIILSAVVALERTSVQIGTGLAAGPPVPIHDDVDAATTAVAVNVVFAPRRPAYPIYQPASTPISGRSAVPTKAAAANVTTAVLLATGL